MELNQYLKQNELNPKIGNLGINYFIAGNPMLFAQVTEDECTISFFRPESGGIVKLIETNANSILEVCEEPYSEIVGLHITQNPYDEMADYYPVISESGEIVRIAQADEAGVLVDFVDGQICNIGYGITAYLA